MIEFSLSESRNGILCLKIGVDDLYISSSIIVNPTTGWITFGLAVPDDAITYYNRRQNKGRIGVLIEYEEAAFNF